MQGYETGSSLTETARTYGYCRPHYILTNKIQTLITINSSIAIHNSEMHRVADRDTPPVGKLRLKGYVGHLPTTGSHTLPTYTACNFTLELQYSIYTQLVH